MPNMGKHRAKSRVRNSTTSRVRNSTTSRCKKKGLSGGIVSNYPVGLFLTLDWLLAVVRMIFFKKVVLFLTIERPKKWYQK